MRAIHVTAIFFLRKLFLRKLIAAGGVVLSVFRRACSTIRMSETLAQFCGIPKKSGNSENSEMNKFLVKLQLK